MHAAAGTHWQQCGGGHAGTVPEQVRCTVVAAGFDWCERAQTDLDGLVQADRPVCEHRKEHNAVGDAVSSGPAVPSWNRERRGRPTAATDDFTASQGFVRDRCSQAPGLH